MKRSIASLKRLRRIAYYVAKMTDGRWSAHLMSYAEVKESGHVDPPCALVIFIFGPFSFTLMADGDISYDVGDVSGDGTIDIMKPPNKVAQLALEWIGSINNGGTAQ